MDSSRLKAVLASKADLLEAMPRLARDIGVDGKVVERSMVACGVLAQAGREPALEEGCILPETSCCPFLRGMLPPSLQSLPSGVMTGNVPSVCLAFRAGVHAHQSTGSPVLASWMAAAKTSWTHGSCRLPVSEQSAT